MRWKFWKNTPIITRRVYYDVLREPSEKEFNEIMNLGLMKR